MSFLVNRQVRERLKEKIGFLPEESYLYPFLTIRETVVLRQAFILNAKDLKKIE